MWATKNQKKNLFAGVRRQQIQQDPLQIYLCCQSLLYVGRSWPLQVNAPIALSYPVCRCVFLTPLSSPIFGLRPNPVLWRKHSIFHLFSVRPCAVLRSVMTNATDVFADWSWARLDYWLHFASFTRLGNTNVNTVLMQCQIWSECNFI